MVFAARKALFDDNAKSKDKLQYVTKSRVVALAWRKWMLLSRGSKIAAAVIAVIVGVFSLLYMFVCIIDLLYHWFGDPISAALKGGQITSTFAVAINTYKRPDMLRPAVQHFADTCGKQTGITQVFVIWAEQGAVLPEPSSFFDDKTIRQKNTNTNRADVFVLQKEKDSLNSRFEPIQQLTSPAVFMVDDDITMPCSELAQAFKAWNAHPEAMVGFYPRLAWLKNPTMRPTEWTYDTWPVVFWQHRFNMVLTKAAFLHSQYMGLYSGEEYPQEIRDYVDKHMNCEDIAMSLLVANYTRYKHGQATKPIYIEGSVRDKGLFGGISVGKTHMNTRSGCVSEMNAILKSKGWEPPLNYQVSLSEYSWFQHAPGFYWQFRASNPFEWGSSFRKKMLRQLFQGILWTVSIALTIVISCSCIQLLRMPSASQS